MTEETKVYVGSHVRIFGEWRQPVDITAVPDADDPLADPTALSIRIYKPDGTSESFVYLTDGGLVRDVAGKYHMEYTPAIPGLYKWFWLPTGNAAQPTEGQFYAHPT